MQAVPIDVKRANSAAANAGATNNVRVVESACTSGAAMIPMTPTIAAAMTVLDMESWFGDRPASIPNTSFSEAARVASPKRVHRYRATSTSAITTTMPVIQNRFTGIGTPNTSIVLVVRMLGTCFAAGPNHNSTVACRVSRMPSDAMSLASGDVVRSGRNTSSSLNTPTPTATATVATTAGAVSRVKWKKSFLKAQNEYAATIATAPVARLMMPEPR